MKSDENLKREYGQFVKMGRVAIGLNQAALARRVGCAQGSISQIERGISWPVLPIAARIARVLGQKLSDCPGVKPV